MSGHYKIVGIDQRDEETKEETEPGFIFDLCLHFPDESLTEGDVVGFLKTLVSVGRAMGCEFLWNDDAAEFDCPREKWVAS